MQNYENNLSVQCTMGVQTVPEVTVYFNCRCLRVFGSSLCPESSNGFLGGVMGRGLKWACGTDRSCGGETSLILVLLFEFVLDTRLMYGRRETPCRVSEEPLE